MDDSAWSSGDIDKDLLAQVNDPNFWQKVSLFKSYNARMNPFKIIFRT
jgi:hypothetical protein